MEDIWGDKSCCGFFFGLGLGGCFWLGFFFFSVLFCLNVSGKKFIKKGIDGEEVAAVSSYMALGRLLNALGKFLNRSLPLLPIYEIGLKVILFSTNTA